MAIKGFHHVAIYTDDIVKSKNFYEAIGAKQVHSFVSAGNGKEILLMELAKGAVFELLQKPAPKLHGSFPHVAIETDNCDELFKTAVEAGAKVENPVREMYLGTMKVKNAFLKGPDDETIELFEVL